MRQIRLITLALFAWAPLAAAQAPQSNAAGSDPANEVRQLHRRYGDALVTKDLATLQQLWSDDYVFTNNSGAVMTRAQRLENVRSSATEIRAVDETDIRVRVYGGDAAVVTSHLVLKARYSGRESSGEYRNTAVWVKTSAGWRMVANQITSVVK